MCEAPNCTHFVDADRRDPTGTTKIRKAFEADAVRRFKRVRRLIVEAVAEKDVLGIGKPVAGFADRAPPQGAYAFARDPQKVELFMGWLRQMQDETILEIQPGAQVASAGANAWSSTYISRAYKTGVDGAAKSLRKGGAQVSPGWVESAFNRPIHADRIGLAFTRTFLDLQAVTEVMDVQISRVLAEGLARGDGPMVIARRMADRVDKVGITRARVIARTELSRAHNSARIASFREAGIENVDIEVELLTAGDPCPECVDAREAGPYTLSEADALIPIHPNCACVANPKVIGGTGIELL